MLHFVDASSILDLYAFFRLAALCSPLDFPFHTRLRIFLIRRNGSRPQITAGSRTTVHGTNVDLSVSCTDRRAAHVPCGEQTGSIGSRGVKAACRHPPFYSGHLQRQFFQIANRPDLQVWPVLFMRKTAAENRLSVLQPSCTNRCFLSKCPAIIDELCYFLYTEHSATGTIFLLCHRLAITGKRKRIKENGIL